MATGQTVCLTDRVSPHALLSLIRGMIMIPGLTLLNDWISPEIESSLIARMDQEEWDESIHRRVQHYGHRYDYRSRSVQGLEIGPLPDWLEGLAQKLEAVMGCRPDQVIINEYVPGQGISKHIDCPVCFANVVVSLSLLSGATMRFDDHKALDIRRKESLYLHPRSLLILKDEARYKWRHEIIKRRSDPVGDQVIERTRRVSVTFRNVHVGNS